MRRLLSSLGRWLFEKGTEPASSLAALLAVSSLRTTLIVKLERSKGAWDSSIMRFRTLHWFCLAGVIIVPTCLASLKQYMSPLWFNLLSVLVAIFGSVQAIVKPGDKFMRDIEFRDEADFLLRQAQSTEDPVQIKRLMERFERVERRFHQGSHPWPVRKRPETRKPRRSRLLGNTRQP